ncbi:MAG: alkaline phosphatase [Deltaproteobacteria bacterium]|nr:alkaline phosphatase [Deltaproteobacteria bacterium]
MKGDTGRKLLLLLSKVTIVLALYLISISFSVNQGEAAQSPTPKYIFIFLADGAGLSHLELTRRYNRLIHGEGFTITDKIMREGVSGFLTTHDADGLTTDSAAAATAMALGCKAHKGVIGICADGSRPKSVLWVAKEKGMRIGIATNAAVYDASPAAFVCQVRRRKLYGEIVDQYLALEPDILMGGGSDLFATQRKGKKNMISLFLNRGYTYVSNLQELSEAKASKVLGLFAPRNMSYEIDRDKSREPSIYDMTRAIIRILERDLSKGFTVFIETEHPDEASHRNDVASVIHSLREFDRAVALAYQFYKRHPHETLLLVASDHETGGLNVTTTLKEQAERSWRGTQILPGVKHLRKIQAINISIEKAVEILERNPSPDVLDSLIANHFNGFSLPPELRQKIIDIKQVHRRLRTRVIAKALGQMVAHHTMVYWTSLSHTAQPVFVGALGVGANRFSGYQDNTDFATHLIAILQGKRAD